MGFGETGSDSASSLQGEQSMSHPALKVGRPVWLPSATSPARRYPVLRGQHETELAIVGGGLSGALIALTMAEAGVQVVLLEADRVARGSTAASTALLLQEPDMDLVALRERYGRAASRRIWRISRDAARDLVATMRRLRIGCELSERPSIYFTTSLERARSLRRELAQRHDAGLAGAWLTPGALRRPTGMTGAGAIETHGNAQFDPYRAGVGLARAAGRAGAAIYERSTVRRIAATKAGVRLHTAQGSIDAARVVIATGYATRHFRPLAGRFAMRHTYVMATRPLTEAERREVGLGPVLLWDTERPYHYARWTRDHRLLLGGADRAVRPGSRRPAVFAAAIRELREYFEGLYPALAAIGIETAWEGLFAMTPDSLPYIGPHRRYPNHLFALGYGGNGMTFASLAARILLEQWQGVRSADHALFAFNR
jgi:glycine/D-amino acid oxidase-like deaminating enzyme